MIVTEAKQIWPKETKLWASHTKKTPSAKHGSYDSAQPMKHDL